MKSLTLCFGEEAIENRITILTSILTTIVTPQRRASARKQISIYLYDKQVAMAFLLTNYQQTPCRMLRMSLDTAPREYAPFRKVSSEVGPWKNKGLLNE